MAAQASTIKAAKTARPSLASTLKVRQAAPVSSEMEKLALVAGNVCLGLAALLWLIPLPLLWSEQSRRGGADGGALWGYAFLALPLLGLLSVAFAAVVWRGGLDGFTRPGPCGGRPPERGRRPARCRRGSGSAHR